MIELRTLGALELRGADGREVRRVLQQPKRLALLAYLAVATPRRFHRRDTLLAVFWPELDTEHARAALRRALYFLRRAIGENVIVGRGDEEIGLAMDALSCDTLLFEQSIAVGALAAALELYRGNLLEGFYVGSAPEFERWLERERARLLALALGAGWTLAEQLAPTAPAEAAQRAHWVAALAPYDEATHRRLVALLRDVGDRPGALRAHEEFSRRLRADYAMEPTAETYALVAAIRDARPPAPDFQRRASALPDVGGTATALPDVAAVAAPATGRHAIAVLPFTVRGSRDLAWLGEGLVDLLSTTLDGAGALRAVDPRALLGHLAREEEPALDPQRALAVARRFGAGLYLLGSIVHAGGRIRITATMYDDDANVVTTAESTGSSEAGIFDMVDALTRQLLGGRSNGLGERFAKLAARTTQSLPALKAYLRGESDFRAGHYFQALESFQNAAAEDTCFALAWYRLSAAAAATASLELAREASEQAHANRERLGAHDRTLVDAQRAWLRGDADEAERLYASALATHVDDIEAWFLLGDVLFHHNPRRGRAMAEAREPFERAVGLEPDHLSSLIHLARLAAFERRDAALDALVDRVLKLSPAGDRALSMRALRAFALRNEIEQARIVAALGRARALAVGIAFTDIVLYARDLKSAHRLARLVTKVTRGPEPKALCHIVLAHLDQTRGRTAKASADLQRAEALDPAWALEVRALFALLPFRRCAPGELAQLQAELLRWNPMAVPLNRNQALASHNGVHALLRNYLLGSIAARVGDRNDASRQAAMLDAAAHDPGGKSFATHLARSVRAQVLRAAGDCSAALALLESAPPEIWYQLAITSPFYSAAFERYMRAELLEECDRADEALPWLATMGESSPYELVYVAPARLRSSRIYERRGETALAARDAGMAAVLLEGCDPPWQPLLDEALRRAATAS